MIEIAEEHVLSLSEACKVLPAIEGRKPHPSTLWRWARKGVRGVRLEYARLGRRIVTSREALGRFVNALAEADLQESRPAPKRQAFSRSDRQREKAIAEAEAALAAEGL